MRRRTGFASFAISLAIVAALASVAAAPAAAQRSAGFHGFGPRVGFTIDPDQVAFGMHADLGDVARNLMLFPNVQLGVGDDLTLVSFLAELDYHFPTRTGRWRPYAGMALGPVLVDWDNRYGDGSDWDLGVSFQGGLAHRYRSSSFFFVEMRVGAGDLPSFGFNLGWSFGTSGGRSGP